MRDQPAWRRYLRFWGPNVDADVDDELRFHLDMRQRDYEARGLPPAEARRAARERFGDPARVEQQLRTHDHGRERRKHRREVMSDVLRDLRYALRGLRRAPGFTLVAALTLALGIGATTAIFSVVNAVILRPLPYPAADRVVMVWMDNRSQNIHEDIHSYPNFADLRAQSRAFGRLAAYRPSGYNLTGGCVEGATGGGACEPQRVTAVLSTADLFDVLGVAPLLGRHYVADEETEGKDAVAVISHRLWTTQFGGAPGVVGRTVRLNGRERTVIGVMPKGFAFPSADTDVWVPLAAPAQARAARGSYWLYIVGRLAPGATLDRARSDLGTIWTRLVREYPASFQDYGLNLVPLPEQIVGKSLRTALWVMLGAVGAVLLIGCANVANLLLSRAAARSREVSVRLALGAGRRRLVRQLLTESVALAALGGVLGVALASAGLRVLTRLAPADIPRLDEVRVDGPVLGVALAVVVGVGLLFGLAPALQSSRPDLAGTLREGGRGGTGGRRGNRTRHLLVGAQVALVLVLLSAAGLLTRSFVELQRVSLGFRPDHLLTMRVSLPAAKYQQDAQRLAFWDGLVGLLRAVPGVQSVGATSSIFLSQTPNSGTFTVEGRAPRPEEQGLETPTDAVTPDYFRVMGVPLVRGRAFTAQDGPNAAPVAIVNANFARRFWPNVDPVGRRFKFGGPQSQAPWMTVVGVVADMRRTGFDAPVRYETFLPLAQSGDGALTLVVRTAGEPAAVSSAARAAVRSVDPDQAVFEMRTMDQLLGEQTAQRRFSMTLLGTFAALALLLGVVGVYGVTSYVVAQRSREVGLRVALGAPPAQLVRMVVRQGMTVAAVGIGLGLAGALGVARLMTRLLYQVSPADAATLVGATAVLALATLLANWIPARRAARVDPLVALRSD
jgi:putative ABC transport system permease protein